MNVQIIDGWLQIQFDLLGLALVAPFLIGAIMSALGYNFTDYKYLEKMEEHDNAGR